MPPRARANHRHRSAFVLVATALLGALCSGTLCGVAHAQRQPERTPPTAAVDHYQRGRELYMAGRYREALAELKTALVLDPSSPNLLYNVARVNENLGNLDEALAYYERYLTLVPASDSAERDKTQATIRRLQGAKQEVVPAHGADQPLMAFGPTRPRDTAPGRADALFWITAAAGAALAVGGSVAGIIALQRQNDARDFVVGADGTLDVRRGLSDQANHFAAAADVLFIGSAATITAAALLFFLRNPDDANEQPAAALAVDAHGASLAARFRL